MRPKAFAVLLTSHGNQRLFLGLASAHALFDAADKRLVDLDHPGQSVAARTDHRSPQRVQPRPRGLVAPQAEHLLQADRARARLLALATHHIARNPRQQRRPRVLEDRPGRHRRLATAGGALKEWSKGPRLGAAALRASETVGPAQLHQVRATRLRCRETVLEFSQGPGIILHESVRYGLW